MIAAVYARKSTEQDVAEEAKSVTRQTIRAREYAARKGWTLEFTYVDDAVSGSKLSRPGLDRLLRDLSPRPKFGALIVMESSRLARAESPIDALLLIRRIEDAGVQIWSYSDDRQISLQDDGEELLQYVRSWSDSKERKHAVARVRDAMRAKAERGEFTGGRCYGYRYDRGARKFVVDPSEARVVRRIFAMRAAGSGLYRIARALEADGVAAPRGGKTWSRPAISDLLKREVYRGVKVWGRTTRLKKKLVRTPDRAVRLERPDLRLVDDKLWSAVQRVNKAAEDATWRDEKGQLRSRPVAGRAAWLLSRFIRCGVCNGTMYARVKKRLYSSRPVYVCMNHSLYGGGKCSGMKPFPVEWADKAICNIFEDVLVSKVVVNELEKFLDQTRPERGEDPAALESEAKRLRAEIARLVRQAASGEVEEISDAIKERKSRLEGVEGRLRAAGGVKPFELREFAERIEPVLKDWREHLKRNPAIAQQVLAKFLPIRLTVSPRPGGGWQIKGPVDLSRIAEDVGVDAVNAAINAYGRPQTPGSNPATTPWRTCWRRSESPR